MKLQVTKVFGKLKNLYDSGKYRQLVLYGSSRSSKSWSILQLFVSLLLSKNHFRITVWRNEGTVCRSTVMTDFRNILLKDVFLYNSFIENKSRGEFVCKATGSIIQFQGADSIGKVLGLAQDISFFNEVTEFKKDVYLQITQRTAETVFCDYNPSKNFWLEDYRKAKNTIFSQSTYKDNAFCPVEIVNQLESYNPWEDGTFDVVDDIIYYKGSVVTDTYQPPPNVENVRSGTANKFMFQVYSLGIKAEKPNKIYHGWKTIPDDFFDKLPYISYYGLDFGLSRPNALIELKYDGERSIYVRELLYVPSNMFEDTLGNLIDRKYPHIKESQALLICDSAKKAVVDGLAQEGFMAVPTIKGAGSLEEGISFIQKLQVAYTNGSRNLEMEYDLYSWQLDKYGESTDIPVGKDDHLLDSVRYTCVYLKGYLDIRI